MSDDVEEGMRKREAEMRTKEWADSEWDVRGK